MCDLFAFRRTEEISSRVNSHFKFRILQFCIICYMFAILCDHLEILAAKAILESRLFCWLLSMGYFV